MTKLLTGLALVFALGCASQAEALSATCLTLPLPAAPLPPTFSISLSTFLGTASATIWRQPCQDGSGEAAVLLRLTPGTGSLSACAAFVIVQNGIQRGARLATSTASNASTFCAQVFVPTTTVLLSDLGQPDYDETGAFTLIFTGPPAKSIEIPAGAVTPPTPPAGPPTLTVHALGCTTCAPGQTLGFELHVTNPGGPMLVELKTGARLPGGAVVTILGRHEEEVIGSGVTVIPLFAGLVLPAGIPAGAYAIEAAILEPDLGATISRHSVPLVLVP